MLLLLGSFVVQKPRDFDSQTHHVGDRRSGADVLFAEGNHEDAPFGSSIVIVNRARPAVSWP